MHEDVKICKAIVGGKASSLYLSMGSEPNWYRIGNKTCYILKVSKFYVKKGYLC